MINDPASMSENFVNNRKNWVPPEGWPIADNLIFSARSSFCILMYCCFFSVFRSAFTHQPSVKSLPGRQSHHFVLLWGFLKNILTNICLFSQLFLTWHTPSRHRLGYNPLTCYKTASTYPFLEMLDTLELSTQHWVPSQHCGLVRWGVSILQDTTLWRPNWGKLVWELTINKWVYLSDRL